MKRTVTIGLTVALAACGQPEPVRILPPANLATCAAAPAVPVLPAPGIERDRATLALWLAEREAGADCRARVAGLKAWMEEPR